MEVRQRAGSIFVMEIEPVAMLNRIAAVAFLLGAWSLGTAQISQGGTPFAWGTDLVLPEIPYVVTEALDWDALHSADSVTDLHKDAPWRFGVERSVELNLTNSGTWELVDGMRIWRLGVHCPEGQSISFFLDEFDLPKGGALYVWSSDRSEFLGGFTEANEKPWEGLAVGLLHSDSVVLELHEPLAAAGMSSVSIGQIVHGYRSLLRRAMELAPEMAAMGPFGNSGACNVNVNCPEGEAWQTEKKSVALIASGGFALCTGALVNNVEQDGSPYFLTANHCLGSPTNWVFYFNHESATCSGSTGPTNQSVSGATLKANNAGSDVALLELSAAPPASFDVHYAGWDASGASPTSAVGIHHPSGDVKKICFQDNAPTSSTASGAAVWWIDDWELGVTEPGSSGSPLFDQNHRIVGQLYGGAAACSGSVNNGAYDYYGKFDVSWDAGNSASSRLMDWLDPNGTGTLVLNGFPSADPTIGCTDPLACNYTAQAVTDDGSCQYTDACGICGGTGSACSGCTDPAACNFDPSATNDDGSCLTTGGAFTLTLLTDNYPEETSWQVSDAAGTIFASGSGYSSNQTTFTETFCLAPGCYELTVSDSYGDGLQFNGVVGGYTLSDPSGIAVAEMVAGGNFGASASHAFCYTAAGIEGCTDEAACNFNPDATVDDGSCTTPTTAYVDADGDGYGAGPALSSCTFPSAGQSDIAGDCDDGHPGIHPGAPGSGEGLDNNCDGTVSGDELEAPNCPGDLNGDGTVAMSDFLVFLGDFGCSGTCIGDLNADGSTSTADMLVLLGLFGTSCL